VGYAFGIPAAEAGRFPWGVTCMGTVSIGMSADKFVGAFAARTVDILRGSSRGQIGMASEMLKQKMRRSTSILFGILCFVTGMSASYASNLTNPANAVSDSNFTLNGVTFSANHAFVLLTDEFYSGRTRALKIVFTTVPMSDELKTHIIQGDESKILKHNHAYVVIFLDKTNKIWEVSLTIVTPGMTAQRPVADKPVELHQFSSKFAYDGKHLTLKNKGKLIEKSLKMEWEFSVDAPVYNKIAKTLK
jgi:hypothetical protein